MSGHRKSASGLRKTLLIAGILLIAVNLRAPITGVAPVLGHIRDALSLEMAAAGALTTLPLLVFAIASPFCVLIGREYGLERSLLVALLLIGGGIFLRSAGAAWTLFAGTGLIGAGIAISNVLLPGLVKREFPDRVASLTSAYALAAGVSASAVSIIAVPLAELPGSGWRLALGISAIMPVIAILLWLPQVGGHTLPAASTASPPHGGKVWKSALAWQVTLFFGLNSLVFYTTLTWLPMILIDAGFSPVAAGSLHGISQLSTAVPGLLLGLIIDRLKDQRLLAVCVASVTGASLAGLMLYPSWASLWAVLFGIGSGASFILGLAFISLRASGAAQAAALSGMAQCIGYLVAAGSPPLLGHLHDKTGEWTATLGVCLLLCVLMAVLGGGAGRARTIG